MEKILPTDFSLPSGERVGTSQYSGNGWEIRDVAGGAQNILTVSCERLESWKSFGLVEDWMYKTISIDQTNYAYFLSGTERKLVQLPVDSAIQSKEDGIAFAQSLAKTRKLLGNEKSLDDGIYFERFSLILPVTTEEKIQKDAGILCSYLTGGIRVERCDFNRVAKLLGFTNRTDVREIQEAAGLTLSRPSRGIKGRVPSAAVEGSAKIAGIPNIDNDQGETQPTKTDSDFVLLGRRELNAFLTEHIIDVLENADAYRKMGIEFPANFVLHGPPGCGKTYAIEQLADYLDWPVYRIQSSTVASPFIHDTAKKVSEQFEIAMENSPSLIVIDEMESYLADRQTSMNTGLHHVEEVAEFLRLIPEANKNCVLVVGMTNRIDMIDSAIVRRGRFDHVLEVQQADQSEVEEILHSICEDLPLENDSMIPALAMKLHGHPMSDITFVIREAARITAKNNMNKLSLSAVDEAVNLLPKNSESKPRISFT